MKIILTKDVKRVGKAYEEVEAADGYALNFLIHKGLAVAATPAAVKEAQLRRKQATDRAALDAELLKQNIASLAEAKIVIKTKANEKGHLYDAIGEPEIMAAAKEQAHIDLAEGVIKLEKPIKELGTFEIPVAVGLPAQTGEIFGKFSITIEAE